MLVYKFDVLEALKENGYNTNRMRKEKVLSESTLQYLRSGKMVGPDSLDKICAILDMQPGNIIKYIENDANTIDNTRKKM